MTFYELRWLYDMVFDEKMIMNNVNGSSRVT
jgi:hypothetical protein